MRNKKIKVIYIAGNGHSGSTLLDIIIGTSPGIFSAGELTFITRDSIFEEYCSCSEKISDCNLWKNINAIWLKNSTVSLEEYKKLRLKYERNKTTLAALKSRILPSQDFKKYSFATLKLFEAIQQATGKNVIVDSSKSPQRIAVLNKIVDLKVLHICRNAKGVLNSAKKSTKKDIKKGIEADLPARRTSKTLIEWVFVNMITELFCLGVSSKKVKYKKYINDLKSLEKFQHEIKISKEEVFSSDHMLAGNILRLKKDIYIDKNLGFQYKRLTNKQYKTAHIIDAIFPFWS